MIPRGGRPDLPPKYPAYLPKLSIYTYLVKTNSILVYESFIFLVGTEREGDQR